MQKNIDILELANVVNLLARRFGYRSVATNIGVDHSLVYKQTKIIEGKPERSPKWLLGNINIINDYMNMLAVTDDPEHSEILAELMSFLNLFNHHASCMAVPLPKTNKTLPELINVSYDVSKETTGLFGEIKKALDPKSEEGAEISQKEKQDISEACNRMLELILSIKQYVEDKEN